MELRDVQINIVDLLLMLIDHSV
jgi:hypothetical protein